MLTLIAAASMLLTSSDFSSGGTIPKSFMATDCGGHNRTPALAWSDPPLSVRSFALVVHDPDAPVPGGFYHWVVYDIPASARGIGGTAPPAGRQGRSTTGKSGYYGPCPPPGPAHHYIFTLYALDVAGVGGFGALTASQLQARMSGHILARATLEATAATR